MSKMWTLKTAGGEGDRSYYKWIVTALLFLCSFLCLEDRVVIFSLLPLIREDLKLSNLETGALMAVFLWTYAALSPFAGFVGDRLPRKTVLIGSLTAWSAVTGLTGLVTGRFQILAARCLLGITQAAYIPVSFAMIADMHSSATRGRALATLSLGASLGPIAGGALAGWMGEHYGWRMVLYVMGLIGIVLGGAMYLILQPQKATSRTSNAPRQALAASELARTLIRCPTFIVLMSASGITSLAVWMLTTWLPILLYQKFEMTLVQSAFLGNFALTGSSLIGALLGGWLSDSVNARAKQYRVLLFAVLFALACPWPLLFRWADDSITALLAVFAFKVFRAMGEANWHPIMYEVVPERMRASAVGISNSFNSIMGGLGALAVGLTESVSAVQTIFGSVAFLVALVSIMLLIAYRWFFPMDVERAQAVDGAEEMSELVATETSR